MGQTLEEDMTDQVTRKNLAELKAWNESNADIIGQNPLENLYYGAMRVLIARCEEVATTLRSSIDPVPDLLGHLLSERLRIADKLEGTNG
jgi:hypothetical protein